MQYRKGKITQRTVAAFMALWLSGFVFLFCCGPTKAALEETKSCPLAKQAHHCDTANDQNKSSDTVSRAQGVCVDCCGFLPAVFDKARKVDQPQPPVTAPERVVVATRLLTPRPLRSTTEFTYSTRLSDKSRTFISTQVFRI